MVSLVIWLCAWMVFSVLVAALPAWQPAGLGVSDPFGVDFEDDFR